TSGPLILEAIKQNNDRQNNDRINEIIAQSVQGLNQDKIDLKRDEPIAPLTPPPPPAPPPIQKAKKRAAIPTRPATPEANLPPASGPAADPKTKKARRHSYPTRDPGGQAWAGAPNYRGTGQRRSK